MTWSMQVPITPKEEIDAAIDAAHDCFANVHGGSQVVVAKEAAKILAKQVIESHVSVSMVGHVHSGSDASTTLNVYVTGVVPKVNDDSTASPA